MATDLLTWPDPASPWQPITDFNEYTYHFLEVIHTHLRFTKGPPQAAPTGGAYGGAALGGAAGATYGAPAGAAGAPQPGGAMYGAPATGTGSMEQLVLSFFQTKGEASDMGVTIADAAQALQTNGATPEQVRTLVEQLVSDGHLYSTIDDDHFKATDSS